LLELLDEVVGAALVLSGEVVLEAELLAPDVLPVTAMVCPLWSLS